MHNLIATLFGPIFAKEMVEMARRKRYFFNRAFYGSVILFATWMVWLESRHRFRAGNPVMAMAELGETLFLVISIIQFCAVFLFVPLFLCGVIASEREERTLDLVFTTDLTNREIILGKLMSRAIALAVLIFLAVPIISIMMLFGGITPSAITRTVAATLLAMLYAGAFAIYFSATTKSALGALVRTYWWLLFWMVGVPLLAMFITFLCARATRNFVAMQYAMTAIAYFDPLGPFVLSQNVGAYNEIGRGLDAFASIRFGATSFVRKLVAWFYPGMFVLPATVSMTLILLAMRKLRREPVPVLALLRGSRPWRALAARFGPTPLVASARRHRRAERTWYGLQVANPLWWRARLARVYDREGYVGYVQWLAWLVVAVFLGIFLVFERRVLADEESSLAFLIPAWIAVALLTVLFAGTSLVGDRRRGLFELVLVTPMTPREIIDGTLLAIWQHVRRLYWLPVALCIILVTVQSALFLANPTWNRISPPHGFFINFVTASLFVALLAIHGIACSLTARTMATSLVMTLLFPVFMLLPVMFMAFIFEEAHGPALWLISPLLLLIAWVLVKRRPMVITVGLFFTAFHLCLMAALTCWTANFKSTNPPEPMQNFHAGFLSFVVLARNFENWAFREHKNVHWFFTYLCYWLGLVVNFFWARWWLIRNFDRLVGRTRPREGVQVSAAPVAHAMPAQAAQAPASVSGSVE